MKAKIEQLRHLVWEQDIPHPTTPEYREHHESIQKILKFIDTRLLSEALHYEELINTLEHRVLELEEMFCPNQQHDLQPVDIPGVKNIYKCARCAKLVTK